MLRPAFLVVSTLALSSCAAAGAADLAGAGNPDAGLTQCEELLLRVCGNPSINAVDAPCRDAAGCDAARLTAAHEPATCAARNSDRPSWLTCDVHHAGAALTDAGPPPPQSCMDLLTKVCGSADVGATAACGTEPACASAREVYSLQATTQCVQALGDDTSFPRCRTP